MMAGDRIKSRASFKSDDWTGKRESTELVRAKASWPCSLSVDLESSELASGGGSGFSMIRGTQFDSGLADDTVASGSPVVSFVISEGSVGSKLQSLDPAVCSGSKARAVVGAVNPSKIKSPRISAT